MAYTSSIGIALGSTRAGLTLRAQLIDPAGAAVGGPVTAGFVEVGGGYYLWTFAFTDGFRGGVKFSDAADGSLQTFLAINPEELAPARAAPPVQTVAGAQSVRAAVAGGPTTRQAVSGAEARRGDVTGSV